MTPPASPAAAGRAARRVVAQSIATLFDQHANMVLGLCRLLLRDHHEAEDAAQQTFVSAYRSMLRGSEPRDPAPWLAAIARNECRARIRKRMRAPVAIDGEIEAQLADPEDLVEVADRRAELAEITVAMADLPTRQREAVALRDFLGLSYEEVASTLSVSVPVVESLLFRARRRLRDTVRTVPRYAAGAAVVPLALRASVSREIPDFDSMRIGAGIVAGTAAAVGAGIAKLISIPFAGKAATAVAVATASTVVGPLFNGPVPPPSDVGVAAPVLAEFSGGPVEPDGPAPSAPEAAPAAQPPAASTPPPAVDEAPAPPPAVAEPEPAPSEEIEEEADSGRMSAESATADGSLDLAPVVAADCPTAEAEEAFANALEENEAEVLDDTGSAGELCVSATSEDEAEQAAPAESIEPAESDEAAALDDDAGHEHSDDEEPAESDEAAALDDDAGDVHSEEEPADVEGSEAREEIDDESEDVADSPDGSTQTDEEPAETLAEAPAVER